MSGVKSIIRKAVPSNALVKLEDTYRLQKAKTAFAVYGKAPANLNVIAVTGTNGKTTTCAFINAMLKSAGYKTAVYTTAFTEINGLYATNHTHMTVASPWSVQGFFKKAKAAKVDWVILEVTSHALDQYRIYGVPVKIAVVTNLTQDHLDYHGTMENYAAAKARLITDFQPEHVILNADDEWFEYFGRKIKGAMHAVGKESAQIKIKNTHLSPQGTTFSVISNTCQCDIHMQLVGEFNVYNAAMAATVGKIIGLPSKKIAQGIGDLPVVEGRMESVNAGQGFSVLVDYAHTPDALKNVLQALRQVAKGRVRVVFGATGDRDAKKREPMGEIAATYADDIYLTDDETYTEDGATIRAQVAQGIQKAGGAKKYTEIADRKDAIRAAFADARKDDIVLLAGIGHQDYRNMGGVRVDWDERVVAKELLKDTLHTP